MPAGPAPVTGSHEAGQGQGRSHCVRAGVQRSDAQGSRGSPEAGQRRCQKDSHALLGACVRSSAAIHSSQPGAKLTSGMRLRPTPSRMSATLASLYRADRHALTCTHLPAGCQHSTNNQQAASRACCKGTHHWAAVHKGGPAAGKTQPGQHATCPRCMVCMLPDVHVTVFQSALCRAGRVRPEGTAEQAQQGAV